MSLNLVTSLFRMMDEDKQNNKLEKLLTHSLLSHEQVDPYTYLLTFKNGITTLITHQFDHYLTLISDPTFYEWGETPYSQMTGDRVCYYLKQIGEYQYE